MTLFEKLLKDHNFKKPLHEGTAKLCLAYMASQEFECKGYCPIEKKCDDLVEIVSCVDVIVKLMDTEVGEDENQEEPS